MIRRRIGLTFSGIAAFTLATACFNPAQTMKGPVDPGVRGGPAGAGAPLNGLTADEAAFFQDGQSRFANVEAVTGGANNGLGARFNSTSVSPATRSQMREAAVPRAILCPRLPPRMGRRMPFRGLLLRMVLCARRASKRVPG